MISYVVALVAILLFFVNPIAQYFSPGRSTARPQAPRPQLNESLVAIESPNDTALECPQDVYSVHLLSREPLVLYIEDFLSPAEREHLLEIRYIELSAHLEFDSSTQRRPGTNLLSSLTT